MTEWQKAIYAGPMSHPKSDPGEERTQPDLGCGEGTQQLSWGPGLGVDRVGRCELAEVAEVGNKGGNVCRGNQEGRQWG